MRGRLDATMPARSCAFFGVQRGPRSNLPVAPSSRVFGYPEVTPPSHYTQLSFSYSSLLPIPASRIRFELCHRPCHTTQTTSSNSLSASAKGASLLHEFSIPTRYPVPPIIIRPHMANTRLQLHIGHSDSRTHTQTHFLCPFSPR